MSLCKYNHRLGIFVSQTTQTIGISSNYETNTDTHSQGKLRNDWKMAATKESLFGFRQRRRKLISHSGGEINQTLSARQILYNNQLHLLAQFKLINCVCLVNFMNHLTITVIN